MERKLSYAPLINSYRLLSDISPQGKEITTEHNEIIVQINCKNAGYPSYKIQDIIRIHARTVQKCLKRVREIGSAENLHRS
jgi:hypothetical protein